MSYNNEMHDLFNPGTDVPGVAKANITGKTFLAYAGPMEQGILAVTPAAAGAATAGVARFDANEGDLVTVARGSSRIVTVTAGGTITAGDPIEVGASGTAVKQTTGILVGWAVDSATSGEDAKISLAH